MPAFGQTTALEQTNSFYLIGNLKDIEGIVVTDIGEQKTVFDGELVFQAVSDNKEGITLILRSLNLISKGVPTGQGDSGIIGITLLDQENKVDYDSKTGDFSSKFEATLHYDLIDEIKGVIRSGSKGEMDELVPYTESMDGALVGRLPKNLQDWEGDVPSYKPLRQDNQLTLKTAKSVIGAIDEVTIVGSWGPMVTKSWQQVLAIQPVFIGRGPSDSAATGIAFNELMNNATEVWNRCGSVHCIRFEVLDPMYIDNENYRVVDDQSEAEDLIAERDNPDAVEIFVTESFSMPFQIDFGGGGSIYMGTASAKIVTNDQNLDVPCPAPCPSPCLLGGTCNCGRVNLFHLAHELGHVLGLQNADETTSGTLHQGTRECIMEASGFCVDNPAVMSANDCRNATNPLLRGAAGYYCTGRPDR